MTAQGLIDIEEQIRFLWEAGEIPYMTHLCGGNEKELIRIFDDIAPTDWVFSSHRAHYHYILHGGTDLVEKIKAGKSMSLFGPRFIASSIVAGQCSMAAGMALAIKLKNGSEKVWCFVGDGAEDSGHFYESVFLSIERALPIHFFIEDNDSSCGVTKAQRRGTAYGPRSWPDRYVTRYHYTPSWPHAGSGTRPKLKWKVR